MVGYKEKSGFFPSFTTTVVNLHTFSYALHNFFLLHAHKNENTHDLAATSKAKNKDKIEVLKNCTS